MNLKVREKKILAGNLVEQYGKQIAANHIIVRGALATRLGIVDREVPAALVNEISMLILEADVDVTWPRTRPTN